MSSASEEAKSKKQKDVEDYLSKIKLREVFQVKAYSQLQCFPHGADMSALYQKYNL